MSEIAREAAWLTTEESEILIARHEGTAISREFFRRGKTQTGLVVAAGTALAFAVRAAAINPHDYFLVLFAVAGLSLGLIPLVLHWERRQAASRAGDAELREGFGQGAARFVSLLIRQGDAPTGEDRGMLWFEEGKMYFSGHRTSFGLVPAQVRDYPSLKPPLSRIRNEVNVVLALDSEAGPVSVSFGLFLAPETNTRAVHSALRIDIDRWKRDKTADEGQWPPLSMGPLVISNRRLWAEALGWTFFLPLLPATFLLSVGAWGYGAFVYVVGAVVLALHAQGSLRWGALRARWRLWRGR